MNHDSLIRKIKALLALATSPNEAESKAAFSKAQELMAKFAINITEDKTELIMEDEYTSKSYTCLGFQEALPEICFTISKIFGGYAFKRQYTPFIVGFPTNIKIIKYTIDCVVEQLMLDYKKDYREKGMGISFGWWRGASVALMKKYDKESKVGEGLILYNKAQEYMKRYKLSHDRYLTNLNGYQSGFSSGQKVEIRPGVSATPFKGNLLT